MRRRPKSPFPLDEARPNEYLVAMTAKYSWAHLLGRVFESQLVVVARRILSCCNDLDRCWSTLGNGCSDLIDFGLESSIHFSLTVVFCSTSGH